MSLKSLCLCLVFFPAGVYAGLPADSAAYPITGNVQLDFFGLRDVSPFPKVLQQDATMQTSGSRKSGWIAAGLSLVVPGAGEFYTESYWKSAAFFVVEAALWGLAYYWDHRGDVQTDNFQDFANAHWSVRRYIQYAVDNFDPMDPATGQKFKDETGQFYSGVENPDAPWVGVNWATVNRMESAIASQGGAGQYYSHNLAPYGDQQYFEMIGKYEQFNMGWDDANPGLASDYFTQKANLTQRNVFYAGERGKANTYYGRATTFVSVAILNHLVSAVDAALSASWFNKAHASVGFQTVPNAWGGYTSVPVLKVSVEL
jgi:hypothetical protein